MSGSSPLVKICGIKTRKAAEATIAAGADFLGLIFYPPSPRNISLERALELKEHIRGISTIPIVAVTVNPTDELLESLAEKLAPDRLQLHGNEPPQRVKEIRKRYDIPVIKALTVHNGDDITAAKAYSGAADALLFDAKAPEGCSKTSLPGGNGLQFDWSLLKNQHFTLPWFLSGGLNVQNVQQAIQTTGATHIDISSGVEAAPGIKDPDLIRQFIRTVKNNDDTEK